MHHHRVSLFMQPRTPARPKRLGRTLLTGVALAALLPWQAQAEPQPPTATELMNWAQAQLSSYFPDRLADTTAPGLVFRGPYATGNYMGVADNGTVYALGPVTGGQLLALGTLQDLTCVVKPASCAPSDAQALVNAHLQRIDQVYQQEQTSGAALGALMDGCYLHDGRTRAYYIAEQDASAEARALVNRKRGSTRRNAEVLAERFRINQDGSERREIDVRAQVVYADGMLDTEQYTLVQGSTQGRCATPQVSQELRILGNRRVVGVSVTAMNMLLDRYRLADGAPQATAPRLYRNEVRFNINDRAGVATYATISGPGIVGSAYKMVSPRLLRSAPEFAGRVGNFVDWKDDDTFKACRNATNNNYADATQADCVANGAVSNNWRAQGTDPAQVDSDFAGYGFVAGGTYTIKVYADDGWKTVNGQAGKTPIATYTTTLEQLPASAASLAAGNGARYGLIDMPATPVELAALVRSRNGATLQVHEAQAAQLQGMMLPFSIAYFFHQGRTAASTSSNFYPASRLNVNGYPAVGAPSAVLAVPAAVPVMTQATYAEIGGVWDTLAGLSVRHLITFE